MKSTILILCSVFIYQLVQVIDAAKYDVSILARMNYHGHLVGSTPCKQDSDCPAPNICQSWGECTVDRCSSDEECAAKNNEKPRCKDQCVQCLSDKDCEALGPDFGPKCSAANICGNCTSDADCTPPNTCDTIFGNCVDPTCDCFADSMCQDNQVCDNCHCTAK